MPFTPEQEAALAKMADERIARVAVDAGRVARVEAAKADLTARQEKLRADARGLDPKSDEYRDIVAAGDAEVEALVEVVKEAARG